MSRSYQTKTYKQIENICERLHHYYPENFRELSILMQKYQRKKMKYTDIYEKLVTIFKDDTEILRDYNDTLHSDLKVKNNNTSNQLEKVFNMIFGSLKSNFPNRFDKVVQIIAGIAQSSLNKDGSLIDKIKKLKSLVNNYPDENELPRDIKQEITRIFDEFLGSSDTYQRILGEIDEKEADNEEQFEVDYYNEEFYDYKEPKSKAVKPKGRGGYKTSVIKKNPYEKSRTTTESFTGRNSFSQLMKNENYFFENLKLNLNEKQYSYLCRLIYLYHKCIISYPEMYMMSENIITNLDKQLWITFKEIIESRDLSRRKSSFFYKGPGDIVNNQKNFNANFNQSYKLIPKEYPILRNMTDNKIAIENLNTRYISCPLGADSTTAKKPYDEGVQKKIFLKNHFEETLFHIEDERFEIDINIAKFRMIIKWLEMIGDPNITKDRADYLLQKILKFNVLQTIYSNKTEEYFTAVKEHKEIVLPRVIERVKAALKTITECKKRYESDKWDEAISKNFYRALDTKSFSLKYYERRLVVNKNFINEVPTREANFKFLGNQLKKLLYKTKKIEDMNNIRIYKRVVKSLTPYNTFFGISKTVKCNSNKRFPDKLLKPLIEEKTKLNLPIFSFYFNKKSIAEDALTICYFYLKFRKSSASNKNEILDKMALIFEKFFGLKGVKEFDDSVHYYDEDFMNEIEGLEKILYPKQFSYAKCVREKHNNLKPSNTDRGGNNKKNGKFDEDDDDDDDDIKDIDKNKKNGDDNDDDDDDDDDDDKDSFDKLIDESSNDSNKEILSKMMKFQDKEKIDSCGTATHTHTDFHPKIKKDGKIFYAGQTFYMCYRFFYTLYERFLKAFELSNEFQTAKVTDKIIEVNKMSEEERSKIAEKRYSMFKQLLMSHIKEGLDTSVYEDSLRCIFCKDAGIFFTTDKIISHVLKSLPKDDFSNWIIDQNRDLFGDEKVEEEFSDVIKFSKTTRKMMSMIQHKKRGQTTDASNILSNLAVYRFYLDTMESTLYINIHSTIFKNWTNKGIRKNSKYFQNYVTSQTPSHLSHRFKGVFLRRSLVRGKQSFLSKEIFVKNRISYKTVPNTVKIIPCGNGTEDIFFRKNQQRDQKKLVKNRLKKVLKFRKWLNLRNIELGI